MRRDEAQQATGEPVRLHHREHRAEERAVADQKVEGESARGQAARERGDRDANVVHDDQRTHKRPIALGYVGPKPPLGEVLAGLSR